MNKLIQIANQTSRNRGAVGQNALTPRYVEKIAKKTDTILDFGAGKAAIHTQKLRQLGFQCTAYEFGNNLTALHDPTALSRQYDIVFASNVLNVQASYQMLRKTLNELKNASKQKVLFNYPESPRKLKSLTLSKLEKVAFEIFQCKIVQVAGTKVAPVYLITYP